MEADRREFLKNIGLGSMALGSFPALLGMLSTPAQAQGGMNFHFVTVADAGSGANTHLLASFGQGHFDPRPGSRVDGRGGYFLFRPAASPPFPLVASGRWEARLLGSFKQLGTYGVAAAGIAEVVADIFQEVPSPAAFRGAALTIVCNLRPAGLINPGEIEGVKWSIPGNGLRSRRDARSVPPGPVPRPGRFSRPHRIYDSADRLMATEVHTNAGRASDVGSPFAATRGLKITHSINPRVEGNSPYGDRTVILPQWDVC